MRPDRVWQAVLLAMLLLGSLAAGRRCLMRLRAEAADRRIETVIDFGELRTLARREGWPLRRVLAAVADAGASALAIPEDTLASLEEEGRISILSYQDVAKLAVDLGQITAPDLPTEFSGSLWLHARDPHLLDRIASQLDLRFPPETRQMWPHPPFSTWNPPIGRSRAAPTTGTVPATPPPNQSAPPGIDSQPGSSDGSPYSETFTVTADSPGGIRGEAVPATAPLDGRIPADQPPAGIGFPNATDTTSAHPPAVAAAADSPAPPSTATGHDEPATRPPDGATTPFTHPAAARNPRPATRDEGRICERRTANVLVVHKSGPDLRTRVGLGFSPEFIELARMHRLGIVLRLFNMPGLSGAAARTIVAGLPSAHSVLAVLFAEKEVLGSRGAIAAAGEAFAATGHRLGWLEFAEQAGWDALLRAAGEDHPVVRVHGISDREMNLVYTPDRAAARLARAAHERRIRMLYIRCFFENPQQLIGDLVAYNLRYLGQIRQRLQAVGFEISRRSATDMASRPTNHSAGEGDPIAALPPTGALEALLIGMALWTGPLWLAMIARRRLLPAAVPWTWLAIGFGLWLLMPAPFFAAAAGLAGAIAGATLGPAWWVTRLPVPGDDHRPTTGTGRRDPARDGPDDGAAQPGPDRAAQPAPPAPDLRPDGVSTATTSSPLAGSGWGPLIQALTVLVVPSMLAGLLIAGRFADPIHLLGFSPFRGVKLAFMLPLGLVALAAWRRYRAELATLWTRALRPIDLVAVALIVAALGLYLLRSGNHPAVKPTASEDQARTFLEDTLLARPRNKEFLIGYPAAALFLFLHLRRLTAALPVLALFITVGQVSVVNTFCHFHSPLGISLLRAVNGLWLGLLLGAGAVVGLAGLRVLAAAVGRRRQVVLIGYFGFGNLGDELLWRRFVAGAHRHDPTLSFVLWWGSAEPPTDLPPGVTLLPRRAGLSALLETLAGSTSVVVPGGGVLQSATSTASLLVYLGVLLSARLLGCRLGLVAQGFGPFAEAAVGPFLTRVVLDLARHVSVRHRSDLTRIHAGAGPVLPIEVTADLAFLDSNPHPADHPDGAAGHHQPPLPGLTDADPAFDPSLVCIPRAESARPLDRPCRLGVILRAVDPHAPALARLLAEYRGPADLPVEIVPLSLQSGDEQPWDAVAPPRRPRWVTVPSSRPDGDAKRQVCAVQPGPPAPPTSSANESVAPTPDASKVAVEPAREAPCRGVAPDPSDPLAVFRDLDVVLTMRLHGGILATLAGVPWIAVAIDPKITAFAETAGIPWRPAPDAISPQALDEILREAVARRHQWRQQLLTVASHAGRAAAADLRRALDAVLPGGLPRRPPSRAADSPSDAIDHPTG